MLPFVAPDRRATEGREQTPATPIRRLQLTDVDEILRLQGLCYEANYLESRLSFEVKVAVSPWCFGAFDGVRMLGYALAFPWTAHAAVPLDTEQLELPLTPDCLYIHDVAIDPSAHGRGLGATLVQVLHDAAARLDFESMELVAVQGAESYWKRLGFHLLAGDTSGYGDEAVRMRRLLR